MSSHRLTTTVLVMTGRPDRRPDPRDRCARRSPRRSPTRSIPDHTYPSFEADHLAGLSVWRGKMNKSAGTVTLDKDSGSGEVDVAFDLGSIDFGQKQLERWAVGPQFFDAKEAPEGALPGAGSTVRQRSPTQVVGEADDARRDAPR